MGMLGKKLRMGKWGSWKIERVRHGALVERLGALEICSCCHGALLLAPRLFGNPFVAPRRFENLSSAPCWGWLCCFVSGRRDS
ncbi:hypothetical protein TIFTF001_033089 [Ficus carica]|uniref:Uncharacterized protein n=1 Tax=Ficus carica TaxID=3494 RepID=A0AA88J385_FICCA|nr:hypothetical protein TIFTF001_033089 [Ficus carica]